MGTAALPETMWSQALCYQADTQYQSGSYLHPFSADFLSKFLLLRFPEKRMNEISDEALSVK